MRGWIGDMGVISRELRVPSTVESSYRKTSRQFLLERQKITRHVLTVNLFRETLHASGLFWFYLLSVPRHGAVSMDVPCTRAPQDWPPKTSVLNGL